MLLGIVVSLIVHVIVSYGFGRKVDFIKFNSSIFFNGFLPPIIFNSGYQLNRRLFVDNIGAILSLAIVGSIFTTFIVGVALWGVGVSGLSIQLAFMLDHVTNFRRDYLI